MWKLRLGLQYGDSQTWDFITIQILLYCVGDVIPLF